MTVPPLRNGRAPGYAIGGALALATSARAQSPAMDARLLRRLSGNRSGLRAPRQRVRLAALVGAARDGRARRRVSDRCRAGLVPRPQRTTAGHARRDVDRLGAGASRRRDSRRAHSRSESRNRHRADHARSASRTPHRPRETAPRGTALRKPQPRSRQCILHRRPARGSDRRASQRAGQRAGHLAHDHAHLSRGRQSGRTGSQRARCHLRAGRLGASRRRRRAAHVAAHRLAHRRSPVVAQLRSQVGARDGAAIRSSCGRSLAAVSAARQQKAGSGRHAHVQHGGLRSLPARRVARRFDQSFHAARGTAGDRGSLRCCHRTRRAFCPPLISGSCAC